MNKEQDLEYKIKKYNQYSLLFFGSVALLFCIIRFFTKINIQPVLILFYAFLIVDRYTKYKLFNKKSDLKNFLIFLTIFFISLILYLIEIFL